MQYSHHARGIAKSFLWSIKMRLSLELLQKRVKRDKSSWVSMDPLWNSIHNLHRWHKSSIFYATLSFWRWICGAFVVVSETVLSVNSVHNKRQSNGISANNNSAAFVCSVGKGNRAERSVINLLQRLEQPKCSEASAWYERWTSSLQAKCRWGMYNGKRGYSAIFLQFQRILSPPTSWRPANAATMRNTHS